MSWLSSLPRAASPPSAAKSPPLVVSVPIDIPPDPSLKEYKLQKETDALRSELAKLRESAHQILTLEEGVYLFPNSSYFVLKLFQRYQGCSG